MQRKTNPNKPNLNIFSVILCNGSRRLVLLSLYAKPEVLDEGDFVVKNAFIHAAMRHFP